MTMANAAQPASAGALVLETRDAGVLTLTLNRPDRLNALNPELGVALSQAVAQAAHDPAVRVVVLTGAGRAFCAGGDLAAIQDARNRGAVAELEPLLRAGQKMVLTLRTMRQPVIAAVNGAAAGGGMNIALAADIRIAAENAVFGQSFAKVGLFPDYGGTFLLPRLVGESRAAEMFYTGELMDAQTALRMGVVNHVVPANHLAAETRALANKIAQGPPLPIRHAKQVLFGKDRDELERALEFEVRTQMELFRTEDCGEALRAFFEKRAPKFQGR
ncbi:MAG TPA: enoyl-CoA hydratase-related protein [Candidatus Acidoferrales bacterium]|nr:enoyl-CoA hydratase-related protein [Candidatus Acidoferrales bacterium]